MPAERIALAEQLRSETELDERLRAPQQRRVAWLALVALVALAVFFAALPAAAQTATPAGGGATLPLLVGQGANGTSYSVPVQTLLFFTALSFLPAVLLLMTSFTRIVIVLSLTRNALGLTAIPPNQVVIGLSLFLSLFVMFPTLQSINDDALQPLLKGDMTYGEAYQTLFPRVAMELG